MADSQAQTPSPEEQERAFWEKMTGVLDSWFDNKMKNSTDGRTSSQQTSTGTSRTGGEGRTTLQGLFADFVFGPKKD